MELVFKVYVSHQIFRSDIDLQKSKKEDACTRSNFSSLKFLSLPIRFTVKILKISAKEIQEITNKVIRTVMGIYNSRPTAKTLTEMIIKLYFIIAYHM